MAMDAFDLAERFQTLVFVMSDLDLGMNIWMAHAVRVSRRSRSTAARCSTPQALEKLAASGAATRTSTATAFRTARSPATACRRTSPAAPATTSAASTASAPTTTQQRRSAGAEVRDGEDSSCRSRSSRTPRREVGIIAYGTSHWAIDESRAQLTRGGRHQDRLPAAPRLSVHRRGRRRSSRATTASTSSSRTATAQMLRR